MPTPADDPTVRHRGATPAPVAPASLRRRRGGGLAVLLLGAAVLVGCGDDPNDAPGGSAPPSMTEPSTPDEGTGPANGGQLSPEAQDEAQPTTPNGPPATDDAP